MKGPERPVRRFVIVFAIAYAALLWPRLGLGNAHATITRAAWNGISTACRIVGLGELGQSARFEANPESGATTIHLVRARTGFEMRFHYRSRSGPYWPTALFAALALATPVAWPRRLRVLLVGGACVQALPAVCALARVADGFVRFDPSQATREATLWSEGLAFLDDHVLMTPLFWTLVPLGIWALLAFRLRDWGVSSCEPARETPRRRSSTTPHRRIAVESKGVLAS